MPALKTKLKVKKRDFSSSLYSVTVCAQCEPVISASDCLDQLNWEEREEDGRTSSVNVSHLYNTQIDHACCNRQLPCASSAQTTNLYYYVTIRLLFCSSVCPDSYCKKCSTVLCCTFCEYCLAVKWRLRINCRWGRAGEGMTEMTLRGMMRMRKRRQRQQQKGWIIRRSINLCFSCCCCCCLWGTLKCINTLLFHSATDRIRAVVCLCIKANNAYKWHWVAIRCYLINRSFSPIAGKNSPLRADLAKTVSVCFFTLSFFSDHWLIGHHNWRPVLGDADKIKLKWERRGWLIELYLIKRKGWQR